MAKSSIWQPGPRPAWVRALHEVLETRSAWQVRDLHPVLSKLDAVGPTSGWDALAGAVAVAKTAP